MVYQVVIYGKLANQINKVHYL